MVKVSVWRRYGLSLSLLSGIILGAAIGVVFGEKALVLKPLGDIFLNLMFTVVVPLVFVSIASAVGSMASMSRLGKILGSLLTVFIGTGLVASVLVLVVVHYFPPAAGASISFSSMEMKEAPSLSQMFVNTLTVDDFAGLMSRRNMMPIIVFGILFGLGVSVCGGDDSPVGRFMANLNSIIMKIVNMIMWYAPIGLGAYFAALIGKFGPELISDYGRVLAIYYPLGIFYFFTAWSLYSYIAAGKEGVKRMFKNIFHPAVTAFATQSSVAAIPANMEACRNIGVPSDIYNIVLPIGATVHMDGSVLSSIIKISFLYGVFGMPFTGLETYALAIFVSVLSAVVLSGVPGGGLVGNMVIVSLFGFPQEAFPLIVTMGFLADPITTCNNSTGDTIASMLIARMLEGKDWYLKNYDTGSACDIAT